jgi:hypothetical protein
MLNLSKRIFDSDIPSDDLIPSLLAISDVMGTGCFPLNTRLDSVGTTKLNVRFTIHEVVDSAAIRLIRRERPA